MKDPGIIIFAGHYGSGKTILSINYALHLKRQFQSLLNRIVLCDLDIVNPYFRSVDFFQILREHGIETVASEFANSNVDMPSVPADTQSAFDDPNRRTVVDLGGDDRGALALGRYARQLLSEKNYEMFLVVNPYRPLTRGAEEIVEIKNEIETASGVPFTGIVNNPNLGIETTAGDVLNSLPLIKSLEERTGLPLVFTAADKNILHSSDKLGDMNIFPVEIFKKPIWKVD